MEYKYPARDANGILVATSVVVSGSTTTPLVQITQTGTGDAIRIEDSTSPDNTAFVIDSVGRLTHGFSGAPISGARYPFNVVGTGATQGVGLTQYGNDNNGNQIIFTKTRGDLSAWGTSVASSDVLGNLLWYGDNGSGGNPIIGASIRSFVDATPSGDMPARLTFSTTPVGSTSAVERIRIDNQGRVGIGTPTLGGGNGAFRAALTATGSANSIGSLFSVTAGTDSTTSTAGVQVSIATPSNGGTPYTLSQLFNYAATQGTFNADSTVTSQYGFLASSNMTGAVNNYSFYGNISAQSVTAGSFVSGQSYKITSLGTTDFTLIGATANQLGLTFTASGVGTGTGTAQAVNRWNFFAAGTAENRFQGNTVIDVSTGLDALRVTQRGAGNALVVEDSTNPDSTPFVINTSGLVFRGSTQPYTVASELDGAQANTGFSNTSTGNDAAGSFINYANTITNSRSAFFVLGRSNGPVGVQTIVEDLDELGTISFQGSDGTALIRSASIKSIVDGTPATNSMPGRLSFSTTPSGSVTPTERMRITSTGSINAVTTAGAQIPLVSGVKLADIVPQKPTLDIDFTTAAGVPATVTFTRSGAGVYYDNKTSTKAEQNILLRSQDYSATWTVTNLTPVTGKTAPDTNATATEFTASAANAVLTQSVTALALDYTFSVWIRRVTGTGNIDITAHSGGTWVTQTISGTWARYSVTQTLTAGTRTPGIRVVTSGDVIEVWGAQLEQRNAMTAYTTTTTSQITKYVPKLLSASTDVIRIDHDPVTREPKGILIEESRENLLTYSEDFTNAAWAKTRSSIVSNTIVAPDGTLTGDALVEDTTATNTHSVIKNFTFAAAVYTFSVYVKAAGRSFIRLIMFDGTNSFAAFYDVSTGTIEAGGNGTIVHVGNGWYRCTLTATTSSGGASPNATIRLASANNVDTYTGDGYSGIYIWGAQLEAGAFPTSYIPTVAATVTRGADTATMTGTNFSDWYNPGEGTMYVESTLNANTSVALALFDINDASSTNRISLQKSSTGNSNLFVNAFNTSQVSTNSGAWSGFAKFAGGYALDNFASSLTGSNPATDTAGILPIVTQATIGKRGDAGGYINGHIKRLVYWPTRLANETIRTITAV